MAAAALQGAALLGAIWTQQRTRRDQPVGSRAHWATFNPVSLCRLAKHPKTQWLTGWTDLQASRLEQGEHALRRVEGVSPVVVGHVLPVVLLHAQNPLA